jgi:hypothetical protein
MITTTETISGTEQELLEYFKQKYNLVESDIVPDQDAPKLEESPQVPNSNAIRPAVVGNKITTGFSGLFDGTSWGKQ